MRVYCVSVPIQTPNCELISLKEIKTNYVLADCGNQKVIVYGLENANFNDVYQIDGEFKRLDTIKNINLYSFDKAMAKRHIFYSVQVQHSKLIKAGTSLRHRLYQHLQSIKNDKVKEFGQAMLYGIHDDNSFFMITSCGMHISFITMLLRKRLRRYISDKYAFMIGVICICFISYVTILSSSIIRILCFQTIAYLLPGWDDKDRLGFSVIMTLFIAPYMAWEISLILPLAFRSVYMFMPQKSSSIVISYIVLIPIQFYYFHEINVLQIALFPIFRYSYAFLYIYIWFLILWPMHMFVQWFSRISALLYTLSSFGIRFYASSPIWWLALWIYEILRYSSKQCLKSIIKFAGLLILLFLYPYMDPFAHVHFLDVGQGDCTIIELPYRQGVIMIDIMGSLYKNIPEDIVVPYLHSKGITSIDMVLLTHHDYDHSGGLSELQELIDVKQVIEHKEDIKYVEYPMFQFLLNENIMEDENENSIVSYVELFQERFLFMGDLGELGEKEILRQYPNIETDILKVGHHGSKTSSSEAFLHQLQPTLAIISSGRNNRYGHPSKETVERLDNEEIYYLVTAQNGGITINICKYFSFFRTADNEFGIINHR